MKSSSMLIVNFIPSLMSLGTFDANDDMEGV